LPNRALNALQEFLLLIDNLDRDTAALTLPEQVDHVIYASGLLEMYRQAKDNKSETRVENLEELVNAASADLDPISVEDEGEALSPLTTFLTRAALEAGEGQGPAWEDCVQLMTLHSAKGLEFPLVFLVGLEEGLFPHQQSLQEPGRLEEERRLAYVGITRARQQLTVSYAEKRRLHGKEIYPMPSRFLAEIPAELTRDVRTRAAVRLPLFNRPAVLEENDDGPRPGQRVRHATFGEGVIVSVEGEGSRTRLQVRFNRVGAKWLVAAYAKLERV
jgi:DNA helicase-2/ATP-dependent DNA helicase PcrA